MMQNSFSLRIFLFISQKSSNKDFYVVIKNFTDKIKSERLLDYARKNQ